MISFHSLILFHFSVLKPKDAYQLTCSVVQFSQIFILSVRLDRNNSSQRVDIIHSLVQSVKFTGLENCKSYYLVAKDTDLISLN